MCVCVGGVGGGGGGNWRFMGEDYVRIREGEGLRDSGGKRRKGAK